MAQRLEEAAATARAAQGPESKALRHNSSQLGGDEIGQEEVFAGGAWCDVHYERGWLKLAQQGI